MLKLLLLVCTLVFSADATLFTPKDLATLRVLPSDGAMTVEMIKTGTALVVRSTVNDTLGREWYMVIERGTNVGGFVLASELDPLGDGEKGEEMLKLKVEEKSDRKRRMALIKEHGDWTHRIKSAIYNGAVCLKMSREQLEASWDKPTSETEGFILGSGKVNILFYRPENPIAVVMKAGEVIGWSEKKK